MSEPQGPWETWNASGFGRDPQEPEEGNMTQTQQPDIQAIIQAELAKAVGNLSQATAPSFEQALAGVDPRDSEAALAMLDFLLKTGRLNRVGVLDGGAGYLFVYQEPKGTTKQGYTPGATQGDRIVDAAVDQARSEGKKPIKRGMCPHCFSVVMAQDDGTVLLDDPQGDETSLTECASSASGKHDLA